MTDKSRNFISVTLYSDRNSLITLHRIPDNPDRRLLVTFGAAGDDLAPHGFGTAYAKAKGIDVIYVAQRADTYYQGLSFHQFQQLIGPLADGRTSFAYGGSLGGWCACYFGGAIDAQIISFSPLNPGHPNFPVKGLGKPLLEYAHYDLTTLPRSSRSPVIAHDPFRPDDDAFLKHMILPAYPDAIRYEVPFAGHNVLDRMRRAGTLSRFISSALDGEIPDRVEIVTEGCAYWHQERAKHFRRARDHEAAEREFRAALNVRRDKVTVTNLLSFMLEVRGVDHARDLIIELGLTINSDLLVPALTVRLDENGILP